MDKRIAVAISSIAVSLLVNAPLIAQTSAGGQQDGAAPGPQAGGVDGQGQGQGQGSRPGGGFGRRMFQGGNGPLGGGAGGGNPEMAARRQKMLARFDADHDGVLNDAEKAKMRAFMQQRRQERMQQGGGGGRQFGGGSARGSQGGGGPLGGGAQGGAGPQGGDTNPQ